MKKLCAFLFIVFLAPSLLKAGDIKIETKFMEASPKTIASIFKIAGVQMDGKHSGAFSDAQFQEVIRALNKAKSVNLLCAPSVITPSGTEAKTRVAEDFIFPRSQKKFASVSTGWTIMTTPTLKNGVINYDTQVSKKEAVPASTLGLAVATKEHQEPVRVNVEFLTRDFYAMGSVADKNTVWLEFKTNSDNKEHLVFITFNEVENHVATTR